MSDRPSVSSPLDRAINAALPIVSFLTLAVCVGYIGVAVFAGPYSGLELSSEWTVTGMASCQDFSDWCSENTRNLEVGDEVLQIGDLTFKEFAGDLTALPFAGLGFDDNVNILRRTGDGSQWVDWRMLPFPGIERTIRLLGILFILPFWLAGTLTLIVLRPRDNRWRLIALTFFAMAIWLAAGSFTNTRLGYSAIVTPIAAIALAALLLHMHIAVPSPVSEKFPRHAPLVLYGTAVLLSVAFIVAPNTTTASIGLLALGIAILVSLGLLIYRWTAAGERADRLAARWMLLGIVFSLVPGVILFVFPELFNLDLSPFWSNTVAAISIPAFPAFYLYGIYRRQWGDLEFRANRILSLYSFILIYVSLFVVFFSIGSSLVETEEARSLLILGISVLFVAAAPELQRRYQAAFDYLAYGARHDPDEIVPLFTSSIPSAADKPALISLLREEILPTLFIRQSALLVTADRDVPEVLYDQLIRIDQGALSRQELETLHDRAGHYIPTRLELEQPFEWVRLIQPLTIRDQPIGLWLFGRRDPDDFYPRADIEILEALASQVALAIQNADLFARSRQRTLQQEALNAVISAAAAVDDLGQLLEVALNHSLTALDLQIGASWLDSADILRTVGLPTEYSGVGTQEILARGMGDENVFSVDSWIDWVADRNLPPQEPVPPDMGVRASLVISLRLDNRIIGGLALASSEERSWTSHEIALAEAIGQQLSGTIERLDLLDAIRRQAQQLERILATIQEGILTIDSEHRVLLANPVGRTYLQSLSSIGPGEVLNNLAGLPIEAFLSPRPDGLPHEIRLQDEARVFEVVPSEIPAGMPGARHTLIVREVSEARRMQTRAQQQDRLAAVGQLAAGIAHDFNNIMNAIILFSEMMLSETQLSDRGRERVRTIIQQAQRATTLTRQILDFGRQTIMELRPINLVPFIKEFRRLMERTLPESIRIHVTIDEEELVLRADPARMQQVFMNLVLNARDAMPDGGELRIHLDRWKLAPGRVPPFQGMPSREWVRAQVSDNGSGIHPDEIVHIFEPFYTTKPPGQGTGLGLAQVYGIVKQHSGYIDVQSQLGSGTTFLLYLPALEVQAAEEEQVDYQLPNRGHEETILVVEDEPATRLAVGEILTALNYRVISATNGHEAMDVILRADPAIDLVLSDMVMPGMGGVDLFQALEGKDTAIRMVLMTGYPLGSDTRMLLDRERITWVQKPLNSKKLAEIVSKALAHDGNL